MISYGLDTVLIVNNPPQFGKLVPSKQKIPPANDMAPSFEVRAHSENDLLKFKELRDVGVGGLM